MGKRHVFTDEERRGTQFSSTNQPATKGKKKSIIDKAIVISENKLSKYDCKLLIQYLLTLPKEEINKIATDPKTPIFQGLIAYALGSGDFRAMMELLKFTYGTTLDIVAEVSTDIEIKKPCRTFEEIKKELEEMKKEY